MVFCFFLVNGLFFSFQFDSQHSDTPYRERLKYQHLPENNDRDTNDRDSLKYGEQRNKNELTTQTKELQKYSHSYEEQHITSPPMDYTETMDHDEESGKAHLG